MYLEGIDNIYTDVSFKKTYFRSIYKKYTMTSTQIIDNPTDKVPVLHKGTEDSTVLDFIVPHRGDFIKNIFLNVSLTAPSPANPFGDSNVVSLTGAFPYYMFHHFDLYIGGELVERIFPDMVHLELSLNHYDEQLENFKNFSGEFFETNDGSYGGSLKRTYFAPLPFYFFKKFSLSPPFSNGYEIRIQATMRGLHNLTVYNYEDTDFFNQDVINSMNEIRIENISMPVEYFFVNFDEKEKFDEKELFYIISQTQSFRSDVGTSLTPIVKTNFFNPIKELFFIVADSNIFMDNTQSHFKNQYFSRINPEHTSGHHLESLGMRFDTKEYLSNAVATYTFLTGLQTMLCHMNPLDISTTKPSNYVYNYSFCLDPSNNMPTGSVNFSVIKDQIFSFNLHNYSKPRTIFIYAKSINVLRIKGKEVNLMFQNSSYNNSAY